VFFKQVHRTFCTAQPLDVLNLVEPTEQRFEVAEFGQHSAGSFLTNTRDTRNVVGRIAFKRLYFSDILRTKPIVFFGDSRRVVGTHFAETRVHQERCLIVNQLQLVGVSSKDEGLKALFCRLLRKRADKIVGLEPVILEHRHAHRLKNFFYDRDLLVKFGVYFLPLCFVGRKHIFTEGRRLRIESHHNMRGLLLAQNLQEHRHKPARSRGVLARRCDEVIANGKPCTKPDRMTVDEQK